MSWTYQPFLSGAGQGAALSLTADAGVFAATPSAMQNTYSRRLIAETGAFSFTATSSMPKVARVLSAGAGSVEVSGQEADFNQVPVIMMESGAFTCQPQPCVITMKRRLMAGHRLVRVIGQSAMQADAPLSHQSADISLSIGL
jgi:hypothetical protein